MSAKLPFGVQLPPNRVMITTSSPATSGHSVPFGAGRPLRVDPSDKTFIARCESARDQGSKPGRPTIFADADELAHGCAEYFQWVDDHPLLEQKASFGAKSGKWAKTDLNKKRPYTKGSLCIYLGINPQTWENYAKDERFAHVVALVNQEIFEQKFSGAAAGFFNANIISRDLGLVDRQEVTGKDGGPQQMITSEMSAEEAAEAYAKSRENSG